MRDLAAAVDWHAQNVLAAAPGEGREICLRHHPGIADKNAAAQLPAPQILLDPLDRGDIDGVAREDPMADREAIAGYREPDHDLRRVGAAVLRVATFPGRGIGFASSGETAMDFIRFTPAAIFLIDLEVQRGRVVEDDLDVKAQKIRHPEVDRLLDCVLVCLQEIHRPVQVLQLEPSPTLQMHLFLQPLLIAVELR